MNQHVPSITLYESKSKGPVAITAMHDRHLWNAFKKSLATTQALMAECEARGIDPTTGEKVES